MVTPPHFWRGRRVFLTGHTGFKGSWLALWLSDLGAEVSGYALAPPTTPNLFEILDLETRVRHRIGDVRDAPALERALVESRPEIVIHMAAQPLVRLSYDEPVATYATNVMGTVHMFEAVRKSPDVRAVICVTSDKCYENREDGQPCRETDAMGGHDPYSSSKGCSELITSAWRRSFFGERVLIASARAGNVIGGGDWANDRLVPDLLEAFAAGRRPRVRFPTAVRPWQHVLEPLSGYLNLAERLWSGDRSTAEGWNFGPDEADARPVAWIADRLAALWGQGAAWDRTGDPQPHEAHHLALDCTKARQRLGWLPLWNLDEGLRQTVLWRRALLAGADMTKFSLDQIHARQRASATA